MLPPELFYEANKRPRKRTEGGGRCTLMLHVTPVNLDAHVVVAAGISGMRQGVVPILTSPGLFIPSRGTRLAKVITEIRHQQLLRGFAEGKATNIFDSPPAHRIRHTCHDDPLHQKIELAMCLAAAMPVREQKMKK